MEDRKIIGLDGILQILDKKMAQHLRLKIDTVEFVYCPIHFDIGKKKVLYFHSGSWMALI